MPGWFSAAAPYLLDIITLAKPLFTRGRDGDKNDLVGQQIAELQSAATQNAETTRVLAAEMQKTLEALQTEALALEKQLRAARLLAGAAMAVAALAVVLAVVSLAR